MPTLFLIVKISFVQNVFANVSVVALTRDRSEAHKFLKGKVQILPDCDIPNRSEYIICEVLEGINDEDQIGNASEVRIKVSTEARKALSRLKLVAGGSR